jgi:hypothetical protein
MESSQQIHPVDHQRRTKFTPERIRQIINLVERGTSPDEIAQIVGVTPGTLKTTCSKLHISLRPPRYDTGTGLLRRSRNRPSNGRPTSLSTTTNVFPISKRKVLEEDQAYPMKQEPINIPQDQPAHRPLALVSIVMQYKGETHTADLPLTHDLIGRLALEAEFRRMTLVELIAQAVESLAKEDRFDLLLGQIPKLARDHHS